ncbi:hypothetical protein DPMN_140502 [Dreissena polymorpha]|uniref:Uncharacterized protein n=1 Tax=Dreissena polymorpha TaxID=45954 RepID=A0A9D4GAZ4_DREPO|nr:hypothetical protein DPMN_140502 [Dreissena polymorpha]
MLSLDAGVEVRTPPVEVFGVLPFKDLRNADTSVTWPIPVHCAPECVAVSSLGEIFILEIRPIPEKQRKLVAWRRKRKLNAYSVVVEPPVQSA